MDQPAVGSCTADAFDEASGAVAFGADVLAGARRAFRRLIAWIHVVARGHGRPTGHAVSGSAGKSPPRGGRVGPVGCQRPLDGTFCKGCSLGSVTGGPIRYPIFTHSRAGRPSIAASASASCWRRLAKPTATTRSCRPARSNIIFNTVSE